jgi:hypothetical protein
VPEPTFSQPARRSLLLPIIIALGALALAVAVAIHFFPATTVNIDHVHTDVLPTHTVYKSNSIVLGPDQSQDVLFVATTLRLDNQLRVPIFVDDFNLTLTNPDGAELTAKAVQKPDLENLQLSFPSLKPMVSTPLLRETSIDPAKTAQGTIVFSIPIPKTMWEQRKSAVIKVDVYHQPSLYLTIPKS